jgi:DegV family protein with EDD domain
MENKKKIAIVTDDNAGFTKEEIEKYGIHVIKMPILIDGECFFENENITEDEFYQKLAKENNVHTSQPSPGEVINLWSELLKSYDEIVHIPMSSGLSTSTQSALMLAEDFKNKVYVVDNHRISASLKDSVIEAKNLADRGLSAIEIKNKLEKSMNDCSIYIMVDTLTYLKRGGRVTAAGAAIANTLHLKPILEICGYKLDAKTKAIGTKNAKKAIIDCINKDLNTKFKGADPKNLYFHIHYTHNKEEALDFMEDAKNAFKPLHIDMSPLSESVAVHIGPGSLAIILTNTPLE